MYRRCWCSSGAPYANAIMSRRASEASPFLRQLCSAIMISISTAWGSSAPEGGEVADCITMH